MKLSFIIPNYNDQEYIPQCLDSIKNQQLKYEDYEIIIVNDGSTDDSVLVINEYAKNNSKLNLTLIDKENEGVSMARNTALLKATGKYIYFVDSDDYIAANTLHIVLDCLEKNELEILTFDCINTSSYEEKKSRNIDKINTNLTISNGVTYIANHQYHNAVWSYIVRKDFLDNSGLKFIKGLTLEDCIFTPKLFLKSKKMAHLNVDVYRYLQLNTNSIMRDNNLDNLYKNIDSHYEVMKNLNEIIDSLDSSNSTENKAIKRLENRKQTLVFFLLSKLIKTKLPISKLKETVDTFKELKSYPLNNFISEKYNGKKYEVLSRLFGNKNLLIPFTRIYRLLKGN